MFAIVREQFLCERNLKAGFLEKCGAVMKEIEVYSRPWFVFWAVSSLKVTKVHHQRRIRRAPHSPSELSSAESSPPFPCSKQTKYCTSHLALEKTMTSSLSGRQLSYDSQCEEMWVSGDFRTTLTFHYDEGLKCCRETTPRVRGRRMKSAPLFRLIILNETTSGTRKLSTL